MPSGDPDQVFVDSDGDGDVDATTTYLYQDDGRLLSIETHYPNGVLGNSVLYFYEGEQVTAVSTNHRGPSDYYFRCTKVSRGGEPVSASCDTDGDGRLDDASSYVDCP